MLRGIPRVGRRHFSSLLIHDVTPRDGLQNEKTVFDPAWRAQLVREITYATPQSVEVCSFVREV